MEAAHFGREMRVPVGPLRTILVALGAYDHAGTRETLVGLDDDPDGGAARMSWRQTRTLVSALMACIERYEKTPLTVDRCPSWCTRDHGGNAESPAREVRHVGAAVSVPAVGPMATGNTVGVRMVAIDADGARQVLVELAVQGTYAPLDLAQACMVTGNLREAAGLYPG